MITLVFGTVLPWLLIAVGAWLGFQLVRQSGRILLRLEAIERRLGAPAPAQRREPAGLPVGAVAPDFELSDLTGARRKLSEFRGQDLLLVFFDPKCGFCTKMADDLAAVPIGGGGGRARAIRTRTGGSSSATASAAWSCGRSGWKWPRSSVPGGRRWAIASMPRGASPASWPWAPSRCCDWQARTHLGRAPRSHHETAPRT